MPRLVVTSFPVLEDEPVTVAQLKAQCNEDRTDEAGLDLLGLKLQAASDTVSRYCGRLWTSCTVQHTFEVGEPYHLLPGAGEVTSVTGFYTDVADLETLNDTGYQTEYIKGITVSRDYPLGGYGLRGEPSTFTVTYPVVVLPAQVPPSVKEAILKVAADLYENRENSISGTIQGPLEVSVRVLLTPYMLLNPIYQ